MRTEPGPTAPNAFLEQPQIMKILPQHQVSFDITDMTNFLNRVLASFFDGSADKVTPALAVLLDQLVEIPEG